jgi:uncharacterized membrane protein YgdD (TMEM256/DUF423 family)
MVAPFLGVNVRRLRFVAGHSENIFFPLRLSVGFVCFVGSVAALCLSHGRK